MAELGEPFAAVVDRAQRSAVSGLSKRTRVKKPSKPKASGKVLGAIFHGRSRAAIKMAEQLLIRGDIALDELVGLAGSGTEKGQASFIRKKKEVDRLSKRFSEKISDSRKFRKTASDLIERGRKKNKRK